MRVVFFNLNILFFRRNRHLFRLTLKTTTLTSGNTSNLNRITTGGSVRPLTRNPSTMNTFHRNKHMNITILLLTTLRPTLIFRPMRGVRRNNQPPTFYNRLLSSIPPKNKLFTTPRNRGRLFFHHQGQSRVIQSTVRYEIHPPFLFCVYLYLFSFARGPYFFRKRSFNYSTLFYNLFCVHLHFYVYVGCVYTFYTFDTQSNRRLYTGVLLFSRPRGRCAASGAETRYHQEFEQHKVEGKEITL